MAYFLPDIHVDQVLTNVSLAYQQEGAIGDRIFPVTPVDSRSARFVVYGREGFKKRDDLRRPGASAAEITRTLSLNQYNAEEHALKVKVTAAEEKYAPAPIAPRVEATEFLTDAVANQREYRQVATATDPTIVTQNITLSGTTQWSDYTNSVPLSNIRTGRVAVRNGIIREANMFTLGYEAALVLADHPSVKDLLKYTDVNALGAASLPPTMRGLMVNVAGAMQDTAGEGLATAMSTVWGKNALIHYTNPRPQPRSISFGYTFEAPDDLSSIRGLYTRTWFDEDKKSTWVETAVTYDLVVLAPLAAYLILAAVA